MLVVEEEIPTDEEVLVVEEEIPTDEEVLVVEEEILTDDDILDIEEEIPVEVPKAVREEDDDGVPTYDLTEGYGVRVHEFAWKPKPRGKGSTTPIEEKKQGAFYENRVTLPSRRKDKEYTAYSQRSYIKEGYKAKLKQEMTRLQWLLLFALLAFIFENLDLVGVTALTPAENPLLAMGISTAIILLSIIPIGREFWDGLVLMLRGKPIPESIVLPLALFPIGYYGLMLATDSIPVMLFGFAFAVLTILVKLQTLFRFLREAKTFRVVSADKPKRVLSLLTKEQSQGEREAFAPYVTPDVEYYAAKRTLFVDDYFKMTNAIGKNKLAITLYLVLSIGAAALVFVIALSSLTWQAALSYALLSFYFTLPFVCTLLYELPLLWASFAASEYQAAIIGEAAFEEFGDEGVVSFADSDIFSSSDITLCNILLFRESAVEKLLEYTALVFDEINSSVANVIKRSIPQYAMEDDIRIVGAYEGGLESLINGKRVLMGSYAFLVENKIAMPQGYSYEESTLSQLFVAVEGDVWGKLDFEYTLDDDSRGALDYLEHAGYYIAIRTLDPNLTHAMLARLLRYDVSPIRLIKSTDGYELLRMRKRASSPFVSTKRTKALMNALVLAGKSAYVQKAGMIFAAFSLLIGTVLMLLSVKLSSTVLLSGVGAVLYQIFWLLPVLLLTGTYVRNKKRKKKQ